MIEKMKFVSENVFQRINPILKPEIFNLGIIVIGLFLRIYQYAINRSLWVDEASLTLNILDRDWQGLLQPLAHDQGAPIGFLWLEKAAVNLFGPSEYALRLIPLLAGIAALILFYFLLKRIVSPWAVTFGLALFALSEPLIYFSSEVKQYGLDVLVCMVIVWLGLELLKNPDRKRNWFSLLVIGIVSVWLSHPAALVLAGVGLTFAGYAALKRDWAEIWKITGLAALWLGSFAILYVVSLRHLIGNNYLNIFWEAGFLPLTPSFSQFHWVITRYFGLFGYSDIGMAIPVVGAFLAPLGVVYLFNKKEDRDAVLLISTVLIALVFAAFEFYPFLGRMILYLIPIFLLLTAAGFDWFLQQKFSSKSVIFTFLVLVAFAQPFKVSAINLKNTRTSEELRPVLEFVRDNMEAGDIVFVNTPAKNNLEYYQRQLDFYPENLVVLDNEENFWGHYMNYIEWLDGSPRVWVVLSHYYSNEDRLFESALISHGEEITSLHMTNADAWLYDLR